jgi:hypothetical protein
MRRLTATRAPERGAIAMMVTVLLASGVLLGCAALSVDVGNLSAERRQLQNGADAAALSAAQDCAITVCPTATSLSLTALAGANAKDGTSSISRTNPALPAVCGAGTGSGLVSCPAGSGLGECPTPSGGLPSNYVRVYTQTRLLNGSTILPYYFAQTLVGGATGSTQQTCSAVAWGPLGQFHTVMPITFSYCEWLAATGATPPATTGTYVTAPSGPDPGYGTAPGNPPWPAASQERVVLLAGGSTPGCTTWNGHDAPGGFGWLSAPNCSVTTSTNGWVQTDPGNNEECDLTALRGKVVFMPVYDCVMAAGAQPTGPPPLTPASACATGSGSNTWYHIAGFAAFYVSGWYLSGGSTANSLLSHNPPCSGGSRCVSGWFVKKLLSVQEMSSNPSIPGFGINVVQVVG